MTRPRKKSSNIQPGENRQQAKNPSKPPEEQKPAPEKTVETSNKPQRQISIDAQEGFHTKMDEILQVVESVLIGEAIARAAGRTGAMGDSNQLCMTDLEDLLMQPRLRRRVLESVGEALGVPWEASTITANMKYWYPDPSQSKKQDGQDQARTPDTQELIKETIENIERNEGTPYSQIYGDPAGS